MQDESLSRRWWKAVCMTGGAEQRTELARSLLRGAVDLHIHTAPDIFPRSVDAIEAAEEAKAAGMAAIAVKSHSTDTSSRAETARRRTGFPVVGGVVLNYPVGQGSCKVVNGRSELPIHRW